MKLKLITAYLKLKKEGYDKKYRRLYYATNNLITFEQYEKYSDKIIRKGGVYYEFLPNARK